MKRLTVLLLAAAVTLASVADTAMAGRRARRRRAAVVTGVAVGTATGAVVAGRRRTTVVAAAGRPVAAGVVHSPVTYVAALPDLVVGDMVVVDDTHCVTVQNIGRTAAPASTVRVSFHRVADGALVAATTMRVPPLAVGQSLRFRLHSLPTERLLVNAAVDPENRIVESDEQNNRLVVEAEILPPVGAMAELPDVDVQVTPAAEQAEPIPAGNVE